MALVTGASPTGADLHDWMALRRVSDGGVTKRGNRWLEGGHRVPGYITDALTALWHRGLVTLNDPETGGMARAVLTEIGIARYEDLRRTALGESGGVARSQGVAQGQDEETDL